MKIVPLGDSAVLVEVGADPARVRSLGAALADKKNPGITDVVAAYTTVAVYYDPMAWADSVGVDPFAAICQWITETAKLSDHAKAPEGRERVIPVCYGGEYGPDLADFAAAKNLTPEDVVKLHSGAVYEVRAIGFSPGFPYLAGLPEVLHMPRKSVPRAMVPAGSLGIGGTQTGIYTLNTPGGWHLLGRTPLKLFRPELDEPAFLKVGDRVRFEPITRAEFGKAAS